MAEKSNVVVNFLLNPPLKVFSIYFGILGVTYIDTKYTHLLNEKLLTTACGCVGILNGIHSLSCGVKFLSL